MESLISWKNKMNLRKSNPSDANCILDILHENSRWLDSLGIVQWPLPEVKLDLYEKTIED